MKIEDINNLKTTKWHAGIFENANEIVHHRLIVERYSRTNPKGKIIPGYKYKSSFVIDGKVIEHAESSCGCKGEFYDTVIKGKLPYTQVTEDSGDIETRYVNQ